MTRQECWARAVIVQLLDNSTGVSVDIADKVLSAYDQRFPPTTELEKQANESWMADCMAAVKGLKVTISNAEMTGNPVVDIIESMKSTLLLCKLVLEVLPAHGEWDPLNAIKELGL